MKIAMPNRDGNVNDHFGSNREFIVFDTDNGKIIGKKTLTNENLDYEYLICMLQAEGVKVIIAGRIGRPVVEMLLYTGLQVITGISGEVEKVASDFLSGQLVTGAEQCKCGGQHDQGSHS
ncbi:MAG: NifB/NifX family molybdenum-iron cluster-binding protein [Desulfotomaculaceae bacterium]|nr:NifB/NifX family molybdenum-iron cluster-binding protein [Desulfotomaculaceae bacterium]